MKSIYTHQEGNKVASGICFLASLTVSGVSLKDPQAQSVVAKRLGQTTMKTLKIISEKSELTEMVLRLSNKGALRLWLDDSCVSRVLYGSETEFKPQILHSSWAGINRYVDASLHSDNDELGVWILERYLEDYKAKIRELEIDPQWLDMEWSDIVDFHSTLTSYLDIQAVKDLRTAQYFTTQQFAHATNDKSLEEHASDLAVRRKAVEIVVGELKSRCEVLESLIKNARESQGINSWRGIADCLSNASIYHLAPIFGEKTLMSLKLGLANVSETAYECSAADFRHYAGIKHSSVPFWKKEKLQPVCFLSGVIVNKDLSRLYDNPVMHNLFATMYDNPGIRNEVFRHLKRYGVPSSAASLLYGIQEPSLNWYTLGGDGVKKLRGLWLKAWINYAVNRSSATLKSLLDDANITSPVEIRKVADTMKMPTLDGGSTTLLEPIVSVFEDFYTKHEGLAKKKNIQKKLSQYLPKLRQQAANKVEKLLRRENPSLFQGTFGKQVRNITFSDNANNEYSYIKEYSDEEATEIGADEAEIDGGYQSAVE